METQNLWIQKITADGPAEQEDLVAVEATYHLHINNAEAFSFTCTPSNLEEMALGALYSRNRIETAGQIAALEIDGPEIRVTLNAPATPAAHPPVRAIQLDRETLFRTVREIFSNPDTLFNRTGCAHSCSLMHRGAIVCTFEDIGRHNALDKAIGFALRNGIPMGECAVFTSGRISGDYMAKLLRAGIPVAVSRAAVTSEAVRLAKSHGVTLYGFVRGASANLYT